MRAWANGRLLHPAAPALSPFDHGLTTGDGVFETVEVVRGVPFALSRHLRRLARSAAGLGLPEPDLDQVRAAADAVLAAEAVPYGVLRVTFTAGVSPLGSLRAPTVEPSLVVAVAATTPKPANTAAVTVPWVRNERGALTGLKTTSYAENVRSLRYAAARGATEAILANTVGALCEGTGSNVVCILDGRPATPPLSSGCLAGVTRELLLGWCDVPERDLTMADLAAAEEVLLTSTTRHVQVVDRLDGRVLPDSVGSRLAAQWRKHAAEDQDP